jgi:internalin A
VIVVLNKIHEHPFDVNRGALQQKFPNIRRFIATDCETETGLANCGPRLSKKPTP